MENQGNNGTLGSAGIRSNQTQSSGGFGNTFPRRGVMTINTYYYGSNSNNNLTNVIIHEMGHILGIGILTNISGAPIVNNSNGNPDLYTGTNAVREYKNYISISNSNNSNSESIDSTLIQGLPLENDGGPGTEYGHPEEGELDTKSLNNRRYTVNGNSILHPGLRTELMTGWETTNDSGISELSKVTIGFLDDLGYTVKYDNADDYTLTW